MGQVNRREAARRRLREERRKRLTCRPSVMKLEDRFMLSWTIDFTFNEASTPGFQTVPNSLEARASIQDDNGKIIMVGYSGSETDLNFAVARLTSNGERDTTFGSSGLGVYDPGTAFNDGPARANAIVIQENVEPVDSGTVQGTACGTTAPSDRYVVAGRHFPISGVAIKTFAMLRLCTDGTLDTSFGGDSGQFWQNTGVPGWSTVAFESVFCDSGGGTSWSRQDEAFTIAVEPDGAKRIALGGFAYINDAVGDLTRSRRFAVARFTEHGDVYFASAGGLRSPGMSTLCSYYLGDQLIFKPHDVAGESGTELNSELRSLLLIPDQGSGAGNYDILVAGGTFWEGTDASFRQDFAVARLNYSNGTLESSFGDSGVALIDFSSGTNTRYDMAWDLGIEDFGSGPRIVVAGEACYSQQENDDEEDHDARGCPEDFVPNIEKSTISSDFALGRLEMDGDPDATFFTTGETTITNRNRDVARGVAFQELDDDDAPSIIFSGYTDDGTDVTRFAGGRIKFDETVDLFEPRFPQSDDEESGYDVFVDGNDKLVLGGVYTKNGGSRIAATRLCPQPDHQTDCTYASPAPSYDGDRPGAGNIGLLAGGVANPFDDDGVAEGNSSTEQTDGPTPPENPASPSAENLKDLAEPKPLAIEGKSKPLDESSWVDQWLSPIENNSNGLKS